MDVVFERIFLNEVKKQKDPMLKKQIRKAVEALEKADSITEVTNIKQLKAPKKIKLTFYRKRIGNYRLGLAYDASTKTIICSRFCHRKEIYSNWP